MSQTSLGIVAAILSLGFIPQPKPEHLFISEENRQITFYQTEISIREVLEYEFDGSRYPVYRLRKEGRCELYLPLEKYPEIDLSTPLGVERARRYGVVLYHGCCLSENEQKKTVGATLEKLMSHLQVIYLRDANELKVGIL